MGERDLTPRSDGYALGCVLFEMLVGKPPITGPTAQASVAKVLTQAPPPVVTSAMMVPLSSWRRADRAHRSTRGLSRKTSPSGPTKPFTRRASPPALPFPF